MKIKTMEAIKDAQAEIGLRKVTTTKEIEILEEDK